MKYRPILFSAPMVRALLDGSKTHTRRVMKPQPPAHVVDFCTFHNPKGEGLAHFGFDPVERELQDWFAVCHYGQPGDRLYVRETWQHENFPDGPAEPGCEIFYRADYLNDPLGPDLERSLDGIRRKWKPAIHQPRWASRITLEIVSVRVERLQDISETDAKAEGITPDEVRQMWLFGASADERAAIYRRAAVNPYRDLWESINGPGSWAANPWVWVIEFKRVTS